VVETAAEILICEVKSQDEVVDPIVQAKANAAAKWGKEAIGHALKHGGKPWSYLLIPDDQIPANASLDGLVAKYAMA
jgi:type III restriction enzyme